MANADMPEKVELQLQKVIDKKLWTEMHYLVVLFGRYICKAQKPLCEDCQLKDICHYYQDKDKKGF
jgi:endonuclease-3